MKTPTFIKRRSLGITAVVLGLLLIASPGTTYSAWTSTVSGASATTIKTARLAVKAHTLPVAQRGVPYRFQLESNAGRGITVTWSSLVALPAGITLSPSGLLSGTPTSTANTVQALFRVTPNKGSSAESSIGYLIVEAPPAVLSQLYPYSNILNAVINKPVSLEAAFTGYPAPTVTIKSGTLPKGLTFDAYPHPQSTPMFIEGTPTEATTGSTVVFTVSNKFGSIDVPYTFQVDGVPVISTTTLPSITIGVSYARVLQATYATRSTTKWTVVSGVLPAGITLLDNGTLTGTATAGYPGTAAVPVTFRVTNAAGSADVTIPITTLWAPKITTTAIEPWAAGVAKSFQLVSQGNPAPTWTIRSGTLPAGLTMNAAGVISGTTSVAGTVTLGLRATNAYGFEDKTLTLKVIAAPVITTANNQTFFRQVAHSSVLTANSELPVTWSIESNLFPNGLTMDPATGVVTGKVTTVGTSSVTVRATNSLGGYSTKVINWTGISQLPSAAELLANGAFSSAFGTWVVTDTLSSGAKATIKTENANPYLNIPGGLLLTYPSLAFSPNESPQLMLRVRAQGAPGATASLRYLSSTGTLLSSRELVLEGGGWSNQSLIGTTPAGTARVELRVFGGTSSAGSIDIDDISFRALR